MTSISTCRLGLGSVQFGQDYGITNQRGRVSEGEVRAIIQLARQVGVCVIDTARLYGEAEAVLGRTLEGSSYWKVVTKTEKFGDLNSPTALRKRLGDCVAQSLVQLSISSVYGLLAHDADDLLGPNGDALWEGLQEQRAAGAARKIGASIYHPVQVEKLLARYEIELVQIPFNAIDQRLLQRGLLLELHRRGVEIHSRSAFLQGLLVTPIERIDRRFGRLRAQIEDLQNAWRAAGFTPVEGALGAVLRRLEIGSMILGVTSMAEFRQILEAKDNALRAAREFPAENWAVADELAVNPARWGELLRI